MKKINLFVCLTVGVTLILSGCVTVGTNTTQNAANRNAIGGGGGAGTNAGVDALLGGGGKRATEGTGRAGKSSIRGTAGTLIRNKMNEQKKELERIKNVRIESINNGQAIKLTFDSNNMFTVNSSSLNQASRSSLTMLAGLLKKNPDTDIHIYGHTDNSGGDKVNVPLSQSRAASVKSFLSRQGVAAARITAEGLGSSQPVANNETIAGRQQNRRVEIHIVPSQKMILDAGRGNLK
ncbi:MAG: OmpA family protein [Dysgonamonadaceae bacterium]|jgi:outer membrane protein OmpA-like peptidoglycan-associated protein|nr:OmpA family protein [Dysgonamonadaceae bacterium]